MSTRTVLEADLADTLFSRPRRRVSGWAGAVGALAGHALLVTLIASGRVEGKPVRPPMDVEFVALPQAEPPLPEPPPPPPQEAPSSALHAAAPRSAAAPAAARAAAIVTAKAEPNQAPQAEEPIDFVSDPHGTTFGGGVVAVGGKADFGKAGARVAGSPTQLNAAPSPSPAAPELTPAADLSQKPRLGESDPCRGYFPQAAIDDSADVSLSIVVGKNGSVSSASLISEAPAAQGFGAAAKACVTAKRFVPALDRAGNPAATRTRINLHFTR